MVRRNGNPRVGHRAQERETKQSHKQAAERVTEAAAGAVIG